MIEGLRKLFNRGEDFNRIDVLLLSKEDCHLCEVALDVIEDVRRKHPFPLRIVKIEPGDEWYERYHEKIPVVLVDGRMAFKYRVDHEGLLRHLRTAARMKERNNNDDR